jgi:hypothetical protein
VQPTVSHTRPRKDLPNGEFLDSPFSAWRGVGVAEHWAEGAVFELTAPSDACRTDAGSSRAANRSR